MCSLKSFKFFISNTIDQNKIEEVLEQLQNIEEFMLGGKLSYFNLDSLFNLKSLSLTGTLNDDFNFEILKKLRIQLESLIIHSFSGESVYWDDESILKLLNDIHFPNLQCLRISDSYFSKVTKKFIDQFPMLRKLLIMKSFLEIIEADAFSNLKHLDCLNLDGNRLKTLKKQYFSELVNIGYLVLRNNPLEFIEKNVFSNLKNLRTLHLSNNQLSLFDPESIDALNSVEIFVENKLFQYQK